LKETCMTDDPGLLAILSDQPANQDQLSFSPYAETLAEIISDPNTDTPLTIGVFGGWGCGKTSLMQMVRDLVKKADFPVRTVWFNAWLYSREQALWRALVSRVLREVRLFPTLGDKEKDNLRHLEVRLYPPTTPTSGHFQLSSNVLPGLGGAVLPPLTCLEVMKRRAERENQPIDGLEDLIADVEASEALTRRDQIAALDDFRETFNAISRRCIVDHGRLVVFVDDLDRCLPEKAVEVLEAVKLFLDVPGCVFVLGIDRAALEEGVRVRYAGGYGVDSVTTLDGPRYLEKIIQIPFSLPPIPADKVADYVKEVTAGNLPDSRCEKVFSVGLEPNPRRIKRTLNIFMLLWRLAQKREGLRDVINPVRLAKIVIIQQYHANLFALIAQGPHYLIDLEYRFREANRPKGETLEEGEDISAGPLIEFLNRGLLCDLLTCTSASEANANFIDLTPAGVLEYVTLTRSTVEGEITSQEATRLPFEPQMVNIPAGAFLMGTPEGEASELSNLGVSKDWIKSEVPQHKVDLPAYAIGRYPVTNAEFIRFVEDGGYVERSYWTEDGWKQKERNGWTAPRYWKDERCNAPSQPVVGVSWYEALAYCSWLAAKTGRGYRLPTEAEWEKAARGSDGQRYPWGEEWRPELCNNAESGSGRTTSVGQYPEGESPFGTEEMVGQVWEWCSSKDMPYYYDPTDGREELEGYHKRILRGGSWYSSSPAIVCRCSFRRKGLPWGGFNDGGFRCARSVS
jgi:formylglycine-generating enzyme required for sulfatase activity